MCSIYNCEKISATVGDDFNTIEYSLKSFSERQCSELQTLCNGLIRDDLTVSIEYPTKVEALKHVSKEKLNHSELRVVRIGNLDYNLCGCMHVPSLRYLQMIMIIGYEKTPRGFKILYACGDQLLQSFHQRYDVLNEASHLLALPHLYVNTGIHRLMNVNKEKDNELQKWVNRYFESVADKIIEDGNAIYYEEEELDVKNFQHLAQYLVKRFHKIVIMLLKQDVTCHVILAHDGETFHANEQFRDLMKRHQLKGGGSKMIAQGGGMYTLELEKELKELKNQLN